jgi:hypothetical protein
LFAGRARHSVRAEFCIRTGRRAEDCPPYHPIDVYPRSSV